MSFLYVTEPDCKIYFKDNQIVMDDNKGLLTKLPIEILEGVILIGNINLTSSCQRELLKRGLPVTFLATNGQYYGRLESTKLCTVIVDTLVIYDITDNKRRLKVAKILNGYGKRVQKSAFECIINKKQYGVLVDQLAKIIREDDLLRAYKIVGGANVTVWGDVALTEFEEDIII